MESHSVNSIISGSFIRVFLTIIAGVFVLNSTFGHFRFLIFRYITCFYTLPLFFFTYHPYLYIVFFVWNLIPM